MRRFVVLATLLAGCSDYHIAGKDRDADGTLDSDGVGAGLCATPLKPHAITAGPGCADYDIGTFEPWVEFSAIANKSSLSLPVVVDLDGQQPPEILVNVLPHAPISANPLADFPRGQLWAVHGDNAGDPLFKVTDARLGMGASVAVADLDDDGHVEILGVRAVGPQGPFTQLSKTDYRVVAWDHEGHELWESERFKKTDFDYGSTVAISDMDHDGSPEIVAGRVILNADGTTRGVGLHGRGSWGGTSGSAALNSIGEGSVTAIADLDLDGVEEVIAGDAWYTPDGADKWFDAHGDDGMVAIANLDDDPEGEVVVTTAGTVRAIDTDGTQLWPANGRIQLYCQKMDECDPDHTWIGPIDEKPANIASAPAIDDIDHDGYPEIVIAAGSQVVAFNHDGSELWKQSDVVHDVSGATGASIFDFDGDGTLEVVYIDEGAMYAFDGLTGDVRFQSNRHASNTMFDYPTIADVDGDGSAEIVVAHAFYEHAISVYGAGDGHWAPTRRIWNQHAYSITNVDDDAKIPVDAVPNFTTHNSWHSAYDPTLITGVDKINLATAEATVCEAACDLGELHVYVQASNDAAAITADPGVSVALYARSGGRLTLVGTKTTTVALDPATAGEVLDFTVDAELAARADAFIATVDDDGAGVSALDECVENDNSLEISGPFCR